MAHLDIDSTQRRVYGHAKQGAGFGAAKVGGYTVRLRGLNPLLAAVSTPTCAPVLVGTRLRGGTANSARGAESFAAEAITTTRQAGAPWAADRPDGLRLLRRRPDRGVSPRRRAVLGHRPDGPQDHQGDCGDPRGRLDTDHATRTDLRRG